MAGTNRESVVYTEASDQDEPAEASHAVVQHGEGGAYFAPPKPLEFIPSGCTLLDCVMGGGYPEGRIVNIVGDRSSGKTLLAIEACEQFAKRFEKGRIRYVEVESAFDVPYAEKLGLPVKRVEFNDDEAHPIFTVEDVFHDIDKFVKELDDTTPALYILDSLDALSDKAELDRDIEDGTYGAAKAKKMSEMFRRIVQKLENKRVCLIIISQIRDNIGVGYGEKHSRSGGRALDFYASIVMYLIQVGKIKKTRNNKERTVGVNVKAVNKKNKVSLPFRECAFQILFEYGIDDISACLNFLSDEGKLTQISDKKRIDTVISDLEKLDDESFKAKVEEIRDLVRKSWFEIEEDFKPNRRKA